MTLFEILPSLKAAGSATTTHSFDPVAARARCLAWRRGLAGHEVAYTAPPLGSHIADTVAATGLTLEVRSSLDLGIALTSSVRAQRMIGHPRPLTAGLLELMKRARIERYTIDNPEQLAMLAGAAPQQCRVVLQLAAFDGDAFGADTVEHAIATVVAEPRMELLGLRVTVANNSASVDRAVYTAIAHLEQARRDHGVIGAELQLAGSTRGLSARELHTTTDEALDHWCARNRFPRPRVVHVLEDLF